MKGDERRRIDDLITKLRDHDPEVRAFAAFRLGGVPRVSGVIEALLEGLTDEDADVRGVAAQALALHETVEHLPRLVALLSKDPGVAVSPLAWSVASLARGAEPELRGRATQELRALEQRGGPAVRDQIIMLLGDSRL